MYADKITPAMEKAIEETNRRREKQVAYNTAHGVDPQPLRKKIAGILDSFAREDADTEELLGSGRQRSRGKAPVPGLSAKAADKRAAKALPAEELADLIAELTEQMHVAAAELKFEIAARLRDELGDLKKELRQMREAGMA
jgi:excinuclease ABC subunit B